MAKKENRENERPKVEKDEVADERFEEEENDFGGLPDRDLKKNLGCG
ncbi:hypothetical protein [Fulvivirga aurantia]|nr:hypothetical protein [Fulvivirga aurantia]